MNVKKVFAALIAVIMMIGCLPLAASAKNVPTVLYVGEKGLSGDNLIDKYKKYGDVQILAVGDYHGPQAYYTLTEEKDVGYVLTFYNHYTMSEMVVAAPVHCGVYCDGDLTIRLGDDVTFDADNAEEENSIGWLVEGQLTVEKNYYNVPEAVQPVLEINGAKAKSSSGDGSIGICAKTLMLNNVSIHANGGYAGVKAEEAIVMLKSSLYANTAPDMQEDGVNLFRYGLQTNLLLQFYGIVEAGGNVDIASFYYRDGRHHFDQIVTYAPSFTFAENGSYSGIWLKRFKLFRNPEQIPSCMRVSDSNKIAKIKGNELVLKYRGASVLLLYIRCGKDTIVLDQCMVNCRIAWWQWIPYILSGVWIAKYI